MFETVRVYTLRRVLSQAERSLSLVLTATSLSYGKTNK